MGTMKMTSKALLDPVQAPFGPVLAGWGTVQIRCSVMDRERYEAALKEADGYCWTSETSGNQVTFSVMIKANLKLGTVEAA